MQSLLESFSTTAELNWKGWRSPKKLGVFYSASCCTTIWSYGLVAISEVSLGLFCAVSFEPLDQAS